jgi:hypothetical protein
VALTPEEVQTVEEAMGKAKGDPRMASIMLCLTERELKKKLNDEQLCHWLSPVPAAPNDDLHALKVRGDPVNLPKEDLSLADAIDRENERFRDGLEGMSLTTDQMDLAVAHQKVTGMFFRNMVQGMFGGMYSSFLQLFEEYKLTRDRLANLRMALNDPGNFPFGSELRTAMVLEEKSLAAQCRAIGAEIIKTNEVGTRGAYLLSVVKQGAKAKKTKKPGFKAKSEIDV